ncbi:hypothetical protein ABIB51_002360 [Arthrobacter sp. UYCu712]
MAMGDSCVRVPRADREGRDMPQCDIGDLQRMIYRHKGKPGIRKAKEAIQLIRVGADLPQETLLRLAIVRAGLPEPAVDERSLRNSRFEGSKGQLRSNPWRCGGGP